MLLLSTARSEAGATLRWVSRPKRARANVLVLHGGQPQGDGATSWHQPSVIRAWLFAGAIARQGRPAAIGVAFVRYAVRGWNAQAPVADGRWALQQLAREQPGLPVGLFGYSMGGRVALRLVDDEGVRSLVTAGAWVTPTDLQHINPHPGLEALLLHGAMDQVTDPRGTALAAEHLRTHGASAQQQTDLEDGHAMMRHARDWHARAARHLRATLVPAPAL
jgi:dienelactone hydrolase